MAQYLRPDSTVSGGTWRLNGASPMHACIDEVVPDDAVTYLKAYDIDQPCSGTVGLSSAFDPGIHTGHVVRVRMKKDAGSGHRLQVTLQQVGVGVISTWLLEFNSAPDWTTFSTTINPVNVANITDYSALQLVLACQNWSSDQGSVTWAEMEIPDASPVVNQTEVTDVTRFGAKAHADVSYLGAGITEHGHVWNTTGTPDISDSKTQLGAMGEIGSYESDLTELIPHVKYYVRAYVTDAAGTVYSEEEVFFRSSSERLHPNAAGDRCVFPFEAGASCPDHYQNVDDTDPADDDTTYVGAQITPGYDYELYELPAASFIGKPADVTVTFRARADEVPTRASARAALKTNGSVVYGDEETVDTTYGDFSHTWNSNPVTGAPWTKDEINALQVGISLRRPSASGTGITLCTQVYLEAGFDSLPGGLNPSLLIF